MPKLRVGSMIFVALRAQIKAGRIKKNVFHQQERVKGILMKATIAR